MADLKLALQDPVYDRLTGFAGLIALVPAASIWQHPPDELDPPIVVIGEMRSENVGAKGDPFDRIDFNVLTVVRKPGREHLTPVQTQVRAALEGWTPTGAGVVMGEIVFESDEDTLDEDGVTYIGIQSFSTFVQPS